MFIRTVILVCMFCSVVFADDKPEAEKEKDLEKLGFVIQGNYQAEEVTYSETSGTTTTFRVEGTEDDRIVRVHGTTVDDATGEVMFLSEGESKKVKGWFSDSTVDIVSKAKHHTFKGKMKTATIEQHSNGKGHKWYVYKYDEDGNKSLDRVLEITTRRKIAYKCDNEGATLSDCDRTVLLTEEEIDKMFQDRIDAMTKKLNIGDESKRMPASSSQ